MTIQRSTGDPKRPAWRLLPSVSLGESSAGKAEPPILDLLLDNSGRTAMTTAQRVISSYPPTSEGDCVFNALQLFAAWVLDLPASERHHHAYPNGLYRHSLEVASFAVQELHERWSRSGGLSRFTPVQRGLWLKVAFLLGLFHDCGKILDIDVGFSASGPCWDPLKESLAEFKARHGVAPLAPTPCKFRRGRGLTGHEQKGLALLPVLMAGPRWDVLRPFLTDAYTALAFRHQEPIQRFAAPFAYLAEEVHRADVRSARLGWKKLRR